jgi:hypothetical protein
MAKPIQLSRIMLIHVDDITAELRSARSVGTAGVLAETNIRGFKCPIELTKRNRR